jgi:sigma-B regulation protein RsbU (phosphoserine phosphatase)
VTAPATGMSAEERLRDIQAITDAAMSRLDEQEFLDELLRRVKAILDADTAAVLLLDHTSGTLIATAAAGLEEEVSQGVRIPVGRGFAGRVAAERRTVIIDRVDHTTVINPILLDKGIRSLIGVPLTAAGQVLGVMHLGSLTARRFTDQDAELLQLAADRAAVAVQSRLARDDRIAATALQRSLVPSALPAVAGTAMAARYIPGTGTVGGDWYDVFTLPDGQLGLVIGDVAGSGLAAAVIMGRMRSSLRSYALQSSDPAEVLALLDRKMQHFEPGAIATVAYVVMKPALDEARISSAGHLPPIIAPPAQPAYLADVPSDLMIGVATEVPRRSTTIGLPAGSVLCLYTDGLVERRGEPLDDSLDRLRRAITAGPPETCCSTIMGTMVGSQPAPDDIALLILQRQFPAPQID